MADSLARKMVVELNTPVGLVQEYNACGLNSIITILTHLGHQDKVTIDELKDIFEYSHEGISYEAHRFQRLNALLRERKVPYQFAIENYTSIQDLHQQLGATRLPVPVFFWMSILHTTQKHYKNLTFKPDFGDVFKSKDKHILLFVGHQEGGNVILFVDPSYQLPFLPSGHEDVKKHYFIIDKKDFYEHTKNHRIRIAVRHLKTAAKKYERENQKTKQQMELK